nr:NAD(P)/FAD-dependent oxidoreductase [Thermoleophilaceae bacterium]
MSDAIVVGSGPNGLACAAVLARAGMQVTVIEAERTIGGGTRTSELTVPGLLHDHCSAVHPMAVGSPLFALLDLAAHGLEWCWPEVDLAHPLDDGSAGVMLRSIEDTAAGLGADGRAWKRLFERPAAGFAELKDDLVGPVVHVPKHPLRLARFGLPAALPATLVARSFRTPEGRALFGGGAAHTYGPLSRPLSSAVGMALISAGHHNGWPVARGGSRAITDALAAALLSHGGRIETGHRVTRLSELPAADAVVL